MASAPSALSLLLTFSLLSLTATAVPEDELSAALTALRNHGGYSLFANAVATSDLYFTLLTDDDPSSLSSFTLLAPPDRSVYSLDVTSSDDDEYLSALRRHVVPRRISLRTVPAAGTDIPTLDPGRSLRFRTRLSCDVVSVSGVDVTSPGIFYGRYVAVHGLGGSVVPRHQPPSFSDRTVPDHHAEAVSPVVPRHQPRPPSDFSDRVVSDPTDISPVMPRQQSRPPPIFSDQTASDHSVADSPGNSDSPVVPRHQSRRTTDSSDRTVSDQLEAISPDSSVVSHHQTPVSSIGPIGVSPASLDRAPAYVAGSVKEEMVVGHVIMARGNTYRLEEEEDKEPMLTCPYL